MKSASGATRRGLQDHQHTSANHTHLDTRDTWIPEGLRDEQRDTSQANDA